MALDKLKDLARDFLPTILRIQGRSYFQSCLTDIREWVAGTQDKTIPPHRLNISGLGPFRKFGKHNVLLSKELAGLEPDDDVLDVGCGIGRTAVALTSYLNASGRYTGLDIIHFAIRWRQRHIGSEFSNFSFVHADVQNRTYNPSGRIKAHEYRLPFPASRFSFCLATSLFTHLTPPAASHYVAEVGRVLKPGGRFLSSWFLLPAATETYDTQKVEAEFPHHFADHAQRNLYAPEIAVAYRLEYLRRVFESAQLVIETVAYGGWSGRVATVNSGQDILVARRVG